ncbi:hypothetical protein [Methylobacterium durans]|uniref:Uncharacterized protein n=1 Tax=Methylobacterium durans TaxID=2202825 RepID=A0A2U8W631_9HYPH|nr:hypothetical protein [Methylobacterium durans]AWN40832.1 hypothetical protein DK389_10205 [Methylobacterium durans]
MSLRLACAALLALATVLPVGAPQPAAAGPAQSYLFGEKRFRNACRPPLKYAAGTCVRRCPAGYQDMGRTCRFRNMRW